MDVFSTTLARLKPWRLPRVVQLRLRRQYRCLNAGVVPTVCHQAKAFKRSGKVQRAYIHHGLSEKEGKDGAIVPRQVTFHIPQPLNTDESRILSAIKDFGLEKKDSKNSYKGNRPAVVILATPTYAHWLEDKAGFIPKVLETVARREKGESSDIQVVCGCVDGLAPSPDSLRQNGGGTVAGGFSILYGDCEHVLPGLASRHSQTSTQLPKHSPQKEASLTIQTSRPGLLDITLPLANTLFKNGRHSTLLTSRWQARDDGTVSQTSAQSPESNVHINISTGADDEAPRAYIPAVPLTVARPIGSGLGNIVRTIVYPGTEGEQPASRELEAKVLEFLEKTDVLTPTIPVWALIIPDAVVADATTDAASSIHLPGRQYDSPYPENSYRDIGHWISKGAIFCRVLSGGGGWGVKAGLLSLDPEKSYNPAPAAEDWFDAPAFDSSMRLSQDISALGNIASPGAYIQFFTAALDLDARQQPPPHTPESSRPKSPTAVFGTTPSTIDNLPPPAADPSVSGSAAAPADRLEQVIAREGHFGFVSEKGMFVEQRADGARGLGKEQVQEQEELRLSGTKIDMPFSYFVCRG